VTKIICGVDVGSEKLDARIGRDGAFEQFPRSSEGIGNLARFCRDHQVELVVMEATGGYERLPFAHLWAAGVPAAVVNPRSVRRFAEAMGTFEKTDHIDCAMIAWYAETKRIKPVEPSSATQQRLTALVLRLRQLTDLKVMQTNQRRLVTEPDISASFEAVLVVVLQQIRQLEAQIVAAIEADPLWRALDGAFRSIKGVADRTVARLMAELPEIGTLSGKAVAKLAGLAPLAHDSGKRTGKRPIRGGRAGVRSILYVVAEVVRRYDPDFKKIYQKLCDAGKPKKVVRTALARKLLVRLNAKAAEIRAQFALQA
jgi:transposase